MNLNKGHVMIGCYAMGLNVNLNVRHKELPLCSGVSFQKF
jgi:hypothetical protein